MANEESTAVANPFRTNGASASPVPGTAMQAVEQERAVSEIKGALFLAKQFPRDPMVAWDRIMNECGRIAMAESALYSYAKGGTAITGPSIRMAETIARNWGNISFGIRELSQANGVSEVEAFAWDLETNTRQVKVFQVRHTRHTKSGSYVLEDSREIYEMVANNGARRLRACILGIIPGDVIEAAVVQCELTLRNKADTSPEYVRKMVDTFAEIGVTSAMIEKRIQRRLDAIQPGHVLQLRKIFNSLRDGMSNVSDWFETASPQTADASAAPPAALSRAESVRGKLRGQQPGQGAGEPRASAATGEPPPGSDSPPQTGEVQTVDDDDIFANS